MSVGAVFKLIANDGKADRMIMATKLLNQRIKDVMCARNAAGKADITPTLVDLERTHILYVNAHFKPFAAIGYEYNKVRPQSGNPSLGTAVTFSIPQFGDFFHDMVCRVRLTQANALAQALPVQAASGVFPANVAATATAIGTYYNLVDAFGNVLVAGSATPSATSAGQYQNFVRYCEFPGNRLFQWVKFDVNGNPLDQYDYMVPTMLEKFCTPPHKRAGFNRLVGQENILDGYTGPKQARAVDPDAINNTSLQTPFNAINRNTTGQSNQTVAVYAPNAVGASADTVLGSGSASFANVNLNATVISTTAAAPLAASWPWGVNGSTNVTAQYDISREYKQYLSGPQTPKPTQPALEIWNKLRFWFNDDVRLSIPSVSIPFGQRFITIEMTQAANLVFEFPAVYLETIYDSQGIANDIQQSSALGIYAQQLGNAVNHRQKTYTPLNSLGGISAPSVDAIELYINNIFVNPEVHDIYIKRIGFSLIRVYRQQWQRTQYATSELLLSQLKWPIEYMFVGARPTWNVANQSNSLAAGNPYVWRDWHRLTHVINGDVDAVARAETCQLTPSGLASVFGTASGFTSAAGYTASGKIIASSAPSSSAIYSVIPDEYYLPVPTVDQLALTSHGIVIFENFQDQFFNSYMPFHYGGTALCTPDDVGALFVNMALFPRSYQPSGHLNISRARETYLKWYSTYIGSTSTVDLIIVAVAINFLLITDGSAVLRYST